MVHKIILQNVWNMLKSQWPSTFQFFKHEFPPIFKRFNGLVMKTTTPMNLRHPPLSFANFFPSVRETVSFKELITKNHNKGVSCAYPSVIHILRFAWLNMDAFQKTAGSPPCWAYPFTPGACFKLWFSRSKTSCCSLHLCGETGGSSLEPITRMICGIMATENGIQFFQQGIHLHLVGCPLLWRFTRLHIINHSQLKYFVYNSISKWLASSLQHFAPSIRISTPRVVGKMSSISISRGGISDRSLLGKAILPCIYYHIPPGHTKECYVE